MDLLEPRILYIAGFILGGLSLLLNIYYAKFFLRRALKTFVIPHLINNGFKFLEYEWLGFFNTGGFKSKWLSNRVPGSWSLMAIYAIVRYSMDDDIKRVTIRVGVSPFRVEEVAYSHEL